MAHLVDVTDAGDPRIAAFRSVRERDLVRAGRFIAEGTVVVDRLLGSRLFAAEALLVLRNRLAGLDGLLARVPDAVPVFVAESAVMDAIAGFPVHRGVLAIAARRLLPQPPLPERLRPIAAARGTVVAAVGLANHDNMGAIFRNAKAFGAAAVLVDETSCDPLYRKAIRVSAGAALDLPFERVAADRLDELLGAAGFRVLALSPGGALDVADLGRSRRATALVVGAEGRGLPADLLARMETVRIAMVPGFDSLNVATSAAIALERLYSAPETPEP